MTDIVKGVDPEACAWKPHHATETGLKWVVTCNSAITFLDTPLCPHCGRSIRKVMKEEKKQ
jgi:hypothetical protein